MEVIAESPPKSQNGKRIACLAQEAGHPASAQEKSEKKKLPMVEELKGSSYGKGKGKIAVSTWWKFIWTFNCDSIALL